jgi:hypothetical protein
METFLPLVGINADKLQRVTGAFNEMSTKYANIFGLETKSWLKREFTGSELSHSVDATKWIGKCKKFISLLHFFYCNKFKLSLNNEGITCMFKNIDKDRSQKSY